MNDPQKLIDIARQIDPDFKDPEQALIDALVVVKALAILESQETTPISIIHNVLSKKYGKSPAERPVKVPMPPELIEEAVREKAIKVPRYAKSLNEAEDQREKKKIMGRMIGKYLSKSGVRTSVFAREVQVSVSTVHGWIRGHWCPQEKYRTKIEQILNGEIQLKTDSYANQAQIEEGN